MARAEEIIKKWQAEQDRLLERARFCGEHNFPHEKDFIMERYNAIKDVLLDFRFNLDKED